MMRYVLIAALGFALAGVACGDGETDEEFEARIARDDCARECTDLNRFAQCVPATKVTECQTACRNSSPAAARDFADCVNSYFGDGTCEVNGCLGGVGVAAPGDDGGTSNSTNTGGGDAVTTCKSNCDVIATDCPDDTNASGTAECKAGCDDSGPDAVASFNTCTDANRFQCTTGTLVACYDNLGVFP